MKNLYICLVLTCLMSSCTYLKYVSIQAEYSRIQRSQPGQVNLKHMIDKETFFIIGKTVDRSGKYFNTNLAVAAYSSKFKEHERVDTMFSSRSETHYGLTLPDGIFTLLVFADNDENGIFDQSEVVGKRTVQLNEATAPEKGLIHVDIELTGEQRIGWEESFSMPNAEPLEKSLFYPAGTIRSLDDPIFSENVATLGMYDPASFNEKIPTMFYALEEDLSYKIPIVFVHGIGGNPRQFLQIINRLDRRRYKPWFYYYPSGGDLEQLGNLFYRIFLSGKVARMGNMPIIIVAHSMGGLVVREALNKLNGKSGENRVDLFVSIATPFGGHPAAASGEKHGLIVLPSWRDVNPDSSFLRELYRKPLPEHIDHQLFYAFQNPDTIKLSDNSDGVVPLSSQLYPMAQKQSSGQFGYNSSHTSILEDEEMISHLLDLVGKVKNIFPEDHLKYCFQGGYDVNLGDDYTPLAKHLIHHYGRYVMAVTKGLLDPLDTSQAEFLQVVHGERSAGNDAERGWLQFLKDYPEFSR